MLADTEEPFASELRTAGELAASGHTDEATAIFRACLQQEPDNPDLLYE